MRVVRLQFHSHYSELHDPECEGVEIEGQWVEGDTLGVKLGKCTLLTPPGKNRPEQRQQRGPARRRDWIRGKSIRVVIR